MRVETEYRQYGKFWLSRSSERKVFGTLVIKDGGEVTLEADINISEDFEKGLPSNWQNSMLRDTIYGEIDGMDQHVVLQQCVCMGMSNNALSIRIGTALIGKYKPAKEGLEFTEFCFSIEGLHEWLGKDIIHIYNSDKDKSLSVSYEPREDIVCNVQDGLKINLCFKLETPKLRSEVKIIQKEYFKIYSEQGLSLEKFTDLAHQINIFLILIFDKIVNIKDVTVSRQGHISVPKISDIKDIEAMDKGSFEIVEKETDMLFRFYYPSTLFVEKEKVSKVSPVSTILDFNHCKDRFEDLIKKWLCVYNRSQPSFHLYAQAMRKHCIEDKFISLAQAIEVYANRELKAQRSFASAIAKIIQSFTGIESLITKLKDIPSEYKKFSDKSEKIKEIICDTRNHYIHYPADSMREPAEVRELGALCCMLEMFIQVFFLQSIGFEKQQIADMLSSEGTPLGLKYYDALDYINKEMNEVGDEKT